MNNTTIGLFFIRLLLGVIFLIVGFNVVQAQKMDNKKLEKILSKHTDKLEGNPGYWQFKYFQLYLIVVTDETHNRMRIITPIAKVEELDSTLMAQALKANFHSVLDAKYAIADDILWSAFLHPLKELTEEQIESAIKQVYSASVTFGTSFSGGDLVFPASE